MTKEQILKDYKKYFTWGGLLLLVLAGFLYFKNKKATEVIPSPRPEEIIIQEKGLVKKSGDVVQTMTDEEAQKLREEIDAVLSMGGEIVQLKDVSGTLATGEAKRAFSDGKFYFKVNTSNLSSQEKGYFYEGFLKKDETYLSIGRLTVNDLGEGELYYSASVNRSDYNEVIITLEPEDGNPEPAVHILEASF